MSHEALKSALWAIGFMVLSGALVATSFVTMNLVFPVMAMVVSAMGITSAGDAIREQRDFNERNGWKP